MAERAHPSRRADAGTRRALLLVAVLAACASEDLRPDWEGAGDLVRATTGASDVYDPEGPLFTADEIDALLADGLGLDEALRLALRNNRRLQAGFQALGVRRADYVQAGLLQNPSLGLALFFPSGGGRTRVTGELAQSVLDIWQLPARRQLASAGMEQELLELGRLSGELLAETRAAYHEGVAASRAGSVARESVDLQRRTLEAVRARVAAGVATEVEASLAHGRLLDAELAVQAAERERILLLRRLAALLSLEQDLLDVPLADEPESRVVSLPEREALVARSRATRLDLRAMAAALAAADARVEWERSRTWPDASAGLAAERPEGGSASDLFVGPALAVELPLFDRNLAQVSRAEFEREETRKAFEALLAETAQQVRAAADRADLAVRAVAFVEGEILPQAERTAGLARQAFDLGGTTVLELLEAERAVLEARRTHVDARLEASLALVDLERQVGEPLAASSP